MTLADTRTEERKSGRFTDEGEARATLRRVYVLTTRYGERRVTRHETFEATGALQVTLLDQFAGLG